MGIFIFCIWNVLWIHTLSCFYSKDFFWFSNKLIMNLNIYSIIPWFHRLGFSCDLPEVSSSVVLLNISWGTGFERHCIITSPVPPTNLNYATDNLFHAQNLKDLVFLAAFSFHSAKMNFCDTKAPALCVGGVQWKLEIGGSAQRSSSGQNPIYGWNYCLAAFYVFLMFIFGIWIFSPKRSSSGQNPSYGWNYCLAAFFMFF